MSIRKALPALATATLFMASGLVASDAVAMSPPAWTAPKRIPGTVGLANPIPSTAPDGTDFVGWLVAGTGMFDNAITGKVRLPGSERWRTVQPGPEGAFLGITGFAPTPSGDFWVVYGTGSGNYASYLTRLDSKTRRWSKPVRLFKDQKAYYHSSPDIGLAADGTLVVTAYAPPKDPPPTEARYRVVVGIRHPGGTWHNRFLSPANQHAAGQHLAVNAAGDIVVSFIQGYDLAEMTVRAATKAHGKKAKWKVGTLSAAGDSQRAHPAIGEDGTAAVVWSATSTSFNTVRMATREVRRRLAPWVGRDVITGASVATDAYGVVAPNGQVTALWRQSGGSTTAIWSRHLAGNTLGDPVQLTPTGEIAEFDGLVQRPDGKAALLYQRFTPTIDSLGLEFRTLRRGVPGPVSVLTGDEATDGNANGEFLGVDAASRPMVIYYRGDFPDTDFVWQSQAPGKPAVMTGPSSGVTVPHAKIKGNARVGKVVTCQSGYWVETSGLAYTWFRGVHRIPGGARSHHVTAGDAGKSLRCVVVASNSTGQDLRLTSKARHIG